MPGISALIVSAVRLSLAAWNANRRARRARFRGRSIFSLELCIAGMVAMVGLSR
jgi:hypothetical protein